MSEVPIEYPFPANPEATGYRVFPSKLEDDKYVFFHGTGDEFRESILADSFRIPAPPLAPSISFVNTSSLALGYASNARSETSPAGCIFAVRYEDLSRKGLKVEVSMLHDYTLDPPPLIIGYCIVPPGYRHV
jgi:hypothetical protein